MRRLRYLAIALALGYIGVALYEAPPADARGWHYHLKKPPKKRPVPKKQKNAYIQTDPLRMVKNFCDPNVKVGPNIVIAMDTSMRMQYDADGYYYDEMFWDAAAAYDSKKEPSPRAVATSLGVAPTARYYRRKYKNLVRTQNPGGETVRLDAESISVVDDKNADFLTFYDTSRLGMARDGLLQAVEENMYVVNFGLVRTRHGVKPVIPEKAGNESPVYLSSPAQSLVTGDVMTGTGQPKEWKVTWMMGPKSNVSTTSTTATQVVPVMEKASAETAGWLMQPVDSDAGRSEKVLVPAGYDAGAVQDSPVATLLQDARAAVVTAMSKDDAKYRPCRNTAVILVVGGKDGGGADPVPVAESFKAVTVSGVTMRVPVYVVAVGAPDADLAQLQAVADAGGGELFAAYDGSQVAFAGNYVVQSVFRRAAEFKADEESEFQTASPIVGSVDLSYANDINGNALPNTSISAGGALSQGANVLITTGFSLPGFEARIRAFRTYKPESDWNKPDGYSFNQDGTRLWVAHTPGADQRNIYTYIPAAGYVAVTQANLAAIKPYLAVPDDEAAAVIIDVVRQQPLGAPISSTPALMAPPSMSPAPDAAYTTFATQRRTRRSMLFYGGNDGMVHAIDARLGVEVWAFVPFNMLPKLQTLLDGQPVDAFDYFVDASPKVADVKVGGSWRTYMFIGNGAGGTYYMAFDVSDAGLGVSPTSNAAEAVLSRFTAPGVIPFVWSYPALSTFDHTISNADAPFGDIRTSAPAAAKTVGHTVSTPAIAQVGDATSPWVMLAGSGFLSLTQQKQANRGSVNAGTTFYVIDAATGLLLASHDVGDDSSKDSLKAALEADPSTTGPRDSRIIDRAYIGDTEGALWRFNLTWSGTSISLAAPKVLYDAKEWNPIYASVAVVSDGSGGEYVFLPVGIDILPWTRTSKTSQFSIVGLQDLGGSTAVKKFELMLDKADGAGGDERPSSNPTVAGGIVFFTTTTEYPDTPCVPAQASLYALTPSGGIGYDLNGDGKMDNNDKPYKLASGRATAVFVADKHLYFGTDKGIEIFGDPQGYNNSIVRAFIRTLAWRERR